jgi:hypothetical protein
VGFVPVDIYLKSEIFIGDFSTNLRWRSRYSIGSPYSS